MDHDTGGAYTRSLGQFTLATKFDSVPKLSKRSLGKHRRLWTATISLQTFKSLYSELDFGSWVVLKYVKVLAYNFQTNSIFINVGRDYLLVSLIYWFF